MLAIESIFFFLGLEATRTKFGRGIDEGKRDLLQSIGGGGTEKRLSNGNHAFLGTANTTLDHQKVVINHTIVDEASQGVDALLSLVTVSLGVHVSFASFSLLADHVNLLVNLGSVVVTLLTSASNLEVDAGRVPRADTSDLAETTVSLAWKSGDTPTRHHTLVTTTAGYTDGVNHFVLVEDGTDINVLLEKRLSEANLVGS